MSFLAPAFLAVLALALPILALYLLRMRRRAVAVPAIFLWEAFARDVQANAPWQRLRAQPLLFLQLAALALLALALARPAFVTHPTAQGEVVLLLDTSASMTATDVAPSRFERARALAGERIDRLAPGDRMTLVAVGAQPAVLVPATDDKGALRRGLAAARPAAEAADLSAALDLAVAAARQPDRQRIVFVSDGALQMDERRVPGTFEYVPVGGSGENVGIAQIGLRETAAGPQLYVAVRNYGARPRNVQLVVSSDLGLVDARRVELRGSQGAAFEFEGVPPNAAWLEARLREPDSLALDDRAWVTRAPQSGPVRALLVSRGGPFLERALKLLPRVALTRVEPGREPAEGFDVYIYEGAVPAALPPGNALFVDPPAATELFTLAGEVDAPQPVVRAPDDPLLRYTDLSRVQVQVARRLGLGAWARPLLAAGPDPLLAAGGYAGRRYAVFAFDLQRSDLPLQVSFPVLVANLVDWLAVRPGGEASYRTGDRVTLPVPEGAREVEVRGPGNTVWTYGGEAREIAFAHTEAPGLYTVRTAGRDGRVAETRFAVNFLDAAESAIRPAGAPPVTGAPAPTAPRPAAVINDLWKPLGAALLGLLVVEWVWFFGWRRARRTNDDGRWRSRPGAGGRGPGRALAPVFSQRQRASRGQGQA